MIIDNSRICVVSGRHPRTSFESDINHKFYCGLHGYCYIHCTWPTGAKNPYFNKIRYLKAYAPYFDYLFWIDDDAFFLDFEKSIDFLVPSGDEFMSICRSPDFKNIHTFISSGQFLLRCDDTGKNFLDAIEQVDLRVVSGWWREDLGFFSNGDQDAMIYLMQTDPRFSNFVLHDYRRFNSRIENLENGESPFLIHFTGSAEKKAAALRRAQARLGRAPSLLPKSAEDSLGVRRPRSTFVPKKIRKFLRSLRRRASAAN